MSAVTDLDDDYIANLEDVLEFFERSFDPRATADLFRREADLPCMPMSGLATPALPGREARLDNESKRCRIARFLLAVEPKVGRHFDLAPRRIVRILMFAQVAVTLCDGLLARRSNHPTSSWTTSTSIGA